MSFTCLSTSHIRHVYVAHTWYLLYTPALEATGTSVYAGHSRPREEENRTAHACKVASGTRRCSLLLPCWCKRTTWPYPTPQDNLLTTPQNTIMRCLILQINRYYICLALSSFLPPYTCTFLTPLHCCCSRKALWDINIVVFARKKRTTRAWSRMMGEV